MSLSACSLLRAAEAPIVSCVSSITADAIAGKSLKEIMADAAPCGENVAAIVLEVLLSSNDPAVTHSKAFVEAHEAVAASDVGLSRALKDQACKLGGQ